MEHADIQESMWVFYAVGYIGLLIRVGWEALRGGTTFSALASYVKSNSLVITLSILSYNAVLAVWMWTDLMGVVGMFKGELNGLTVVIGAIADVAFNKVVSVAKSRLEQKLGEEAEPPPAP